MCSKALLAILTLGLFQRSLASFELTAQAAPPVQKSPSDKLEYKHLRLANKMKVLLIRDKDTPKSSIALNVAVGSMQSPKDLQGLAHLVSYMHFLGAFCLRTNPQETRAAPTRPSCSLWSGTTAADSTR